MYLDFLRVLSSTTLGVRFFRSFFSGFIWVIVESISMHEDWFWLLPISLSISFRFSRFFIRFCKSELVFMVVESKMSFKNDSVQFQKRLVSFAAHFIFFSNKQVNLHYSLEFSLIFLHFSAFWIWRSRLCDLVFPSLRFDSIVYSVIIHLNGSSIKALLPSPWGLNSPNFVKWASFLWTACIFLYN